MAQVIPMDQRIRDFEPIWNARNPVIVLSMPPLVRQTNEHWLLPAPLWAVEERDAIIAANKSDEPLGSQDSLDAQEFELPNACWLQRTTGQRAGPEEVLKQWWLEFEDEIQPETAEVPAEDFLDVPPRPPPVVRLISCCDEHGNYIARTESEMDAVLAERAREAAQPTEHQFDDLEDAEFQPEVNAEVPADDDLGDIPPPQGLTRSDGNVTFAEGDPEAYHPLAGFPAEDGNADPDNLDEIPLPTWGLVRMISDYDANGYIARTQEEMDAVLAERDVREAAQLIPPPLVRCYSNMGTDFALPEPEYLLAMAAHEAEQAAHEAAHEAAEWAEFLKERKRKTREWNKLHGIAPAWQWNDETGEYDEYDDELPDDGEKEQEYREWRLKRNPDYRDGHEFQVTPAQEKLYLEFRATEIEIGRWSEPGLAELRKAWEAFLAARGLEIVLG